MTFLHKTLAAAVVAVLAPLATTAQASAEIFVPAYFYPSYDPAQSQWDEMTAAAAAGARVTAVMNPDNGPGAAPNADYVAAVERFRAAGGRVLGYVYTCYGRNLCVTGLPPVRSVADVLADVGRYATWYGVDGIFLDEMSTDTAELGFYDQVAQGIRGAHAGWRIVGNPGQAAPQAYLSVADQLVTYEGDGSYARALTEPWMTDPASAARQVHVVYNVTGEAEMQRVLREAAARNAGAVYVTDDRYTPGNAAEPNPWDWLPTYWSAQVQALSAPTPATVPEPSTAALLLAAAGVGALATRRRRGAAAPRPTQPVAVVVPCQPRGMAASSRRV